MQRNTPTNFDPQPHPVEIISVHVLVSRLGITVGPVLDKGVGYRTRARLHGRNVGSNQLSVSGGRRDVAGVERASMKQPKERRISGRSYPITRLIELGGWRTFQIHARGLSHG